MLLIDRDFGLLGEFVEVVRRETLRFCCIGSIHVDRGSLFRCLLRNAALGDLETALDRRAQKRVPDARSLTERFDAYLKALRHCRISIRSMTAVGHDPSFGDVGSMSALAHFADSSQTSHEAMWTIPFMARKAWKSDPGPPFSAKT